MKTRDVPKFAACGRKSRRVVAHPLKRRPPSALRAVKHRRYIRVGPVLQQTLLAAPLPFLVLHTGIAAHRIVQFGNGSAKPTLAQIKSLIEAVVTYKFGGKR